MLSSGGITTLETATRFPIRLVESGPAAGALAAVLLRRPDRRARRRLVRHGRHDGEDVPDRGRRSRRWRARSRSRACTASSAAAGCPVQVPVDRADRDRRGRRQHRAHRRAGAAEGRSGDAGAESGPGLLRPGRHRADRHRRRPAARLPQPRQLPRRPDGALESTPPSGRSRGDRRADGASTRSRPHAASTRSSTRT